MLAAGAWLWAVFTIAASTAQTARNAMQRDLIASVGAAGATFVRFLFALPFAALLVAFETGALAMRFPAFDARALAWTFAGAATQLLATWLMLAGMRERSFAVMIAYTKTEPMIIALLGVALLNDRLPAQAVIAILIATAGVMTMSWPRAGASDTMHGAGWRAAALGLGAALFFALSAISYRGALLAIDTTSPLMAASAVMLIGQAMQSAAIVAWLALRDRPMLRRLAGEWRRSLFAGAMGALASLCWFIAFALTSAARVRTLALIEAPMAMVVSRRIFKQGASAREYLGIALIVAGIALLLNA